LNIAEDTSVAQHLSEFNIITNQLSFVEMDFYDEIHALIVLASLPNNWEAMRMAVSSYVGKSKLKFEGIRNLILSEQVRKRASGKASYFGVALNLKTRGKGYSRNSSQGRSRSKKGISEFGSGNQPKC
jgi:hypothetical protein